MTVFQEKVILSVLVGIILFTLGPNYFHFSWPTRIGTIILSLVLAGIVSWDFTRRNKKKALLAETKRKEEEDRIFVPIAPKDIVRIYDGRTAIQADQATAIYVGKWMQVSGTVSNVHDDSMTVNVTLGNEGDNPILFLRFSRKEWFDRLQILPIGHFVKVNGKIAHTNPNWLSLENCELVETAGT